MRVVVVGGQSRNIGKTSVMAALVREFRQLRWTAVKITQYGHGICSRDGERCGCAPGEHPFVLTEERDAGGRGDTCRYLAAGAQRSLWLRAREGQLRLAFPVLRRALRRDDWIAIESNSVLEFLDPLLYLQVLDSSVSDFKLSAARFLRRADALVTTRRALDSRAWTDLDAAAIELKPRFTVSPPEYFSAELARFVRERLSLEREVSEPTSPLRARVD